MRGQAYACEMRSWAVGLHNGFGRGVGAWESPPPASGMPPLAYGFWHLMPCRLLRMLPQGIGFVCDRIGRKWGSVLNAALMFVCECRGCAWRCSAGRAGSARTAVLRLRSRHASVPPARSPAVHAHPLLNQPRPIRRPPQQACFPIQLRMTPTRSSNSSSCSRHPDGSLCARRLPQCDLHHVHCVPGTVWRGRGR